MRNILVGICLGLVIINTPLSKVGVVRKVFDIN